MSKETLFYAFGIAVAVSAVAISFAGLRMKNFPRRAFPVVILWFAVLVGGSTTFAVLHAKHEAEAKAAELEHAGKELEEIGNEGQFEEVPPPSKSEQEGPAVGGEEVGEVEGEPEGEVEKGTSEGKAEGTQGNRGEGGAEGEPLGQAPTAEPGGTLQLAADPSAIAFDRTSLASKAGKVTIDLDNPSSLEHNVAIAKDGAEIATSPTIGKGKTSVSVELDAGTYTFLCTVPGHAEAGMEGTLTVK
jgi:plastocyanin